MTGIDPAVYRTAAQVLRRDGWTQGLYRDADGTRCTVGALDAAAAELKLDDRLPAVRFLAAMIGGSDYYTGEYTVASWNDSIGRTKNDVLTLLEQAAEKLEAEL